MSAAPGASPDSSQAPPAAIAAGALGVVVIGRNEGERLRRCLESLGSSVRDAVYVDSGSRDGSVALARALGATAVELDAGTPFTAARGRNAGFAALEARPAPVAAVQFVDGDCEVEAGWLQRAQAELAADAGLAAVFGRRRERCRDASRYNRLCDLEWDVPVGEVDACGGDVLMRAAALRQVGGYAERLIAGEEPELCFRLRGAGWRIRRVDAPMTVHDAAMTTFGQWWRRAVRAGFVEAEGLADLGARYPRRRAAYRTLFWALLVPLGTLAIGAIALAAGRPWLAAAAAAAMLALYALQWLRIRAHGRRRWPAADAALHATFCVLGKWPQAQGMATYWWRRLRSQRARLIEYKHAAPADALPDGAAPPRPRSSP